MHLRLAFEVFHDVQESIVNIRLLRELNLHLVKVGKSVLIHLVSIDF